MLGWPVSRNPEIIPLPRRRVVVGHRRMLDVYREFERKLQVGAAPDPEALRGLLVFLRDEILPFAHWEEEVSPPDRREEIAFEHAFLIAEIDALERRAREVLTECDRKGGSEGHGRWEAVLRQLARLEAVLQMHVEKSADPGAGWDEEPTR